ncbi:MAG: AAA family ATPase [Flavobacterium sp.]|nr:AAA family ATPase [Flavobacterium sp.]
MFNDSTSAKSSFNALGKYCIDRLKEITKNKNQTVIIGRDEELKTITEVLNRKLKPHVIITGDPGVGKSALIEGFAKNCFKNHFKCFRQSNYFRN